MFHSKIYKFFSSVRLTVALLFAATFLVLFGTLDQVHIGIHGIIEKWFTSLWAVWQYPEQWWWGESLTWLKIPWPGGWLLGVLLLVNLVLGHLRYSRLSWKKAGVSAIHLGVILLLVGQGITDLMQKEYRMIIEEGGSSNYLVSGEEGIASVELAVIETTDPEVDKVTAIPGPAMKAAIPDKQGKPRRTVEIEQEQLPFKILVHGFYPNAEFEVDESAEKVPFTHGVGKAQNLVLKNREESAAMNVLNIATADVELRGPDGSLGRWAVSVLPAPLFRGQTVTVGDRRFLLEMRLARRYLDYAIHLSNFSFDRYPKTNDPFNYSSDVSLVDPRSGEERELKIWMNHPLRYEGLTFFQADFADNGRITVLQVVENVGKWIPYAAFVILSLGLALQFGISLFYFLRKRKAQPAAPESARMPAGARQPDVPAST